MTGETSQTSLLEGGGPPQRWKEFEPIAFTPNIFFFQHIGHMKHMKRMKRMKHKSRFSERRRILMGLELQRLDAFATVGCIAVFCMGARRILYNSGCRVETLLVSKGVMGFLGDLRGKNSKSPPNPLGLAERVPA